jgi:hypothetical protein
MTSTLASLRRNCSDVLPPDFRIERELGRGSNNKVFRVTWDGATRVLRVPRRRSDTQQAGSAAWEALCTARAAHLNVAPTVHDMWFMRHAEGRWASGLYMVLEAFPMDLEHALFAKETHDTMLAQRAAVGDALVEALATLADDGMFVFDLKPSNIVVRLPPEAPVTVRLIDFGRDFCEWAGEGARAHPDMRAPTIDFVTRTLVARDGVADPALVAHLLTVSMVVQLSATVTRALHDDRHQHRMSRAQRVRIHPVAPHATRLLDSMRGENVAVVRQVLRSDDVRGVLQHYHGRRDAGTRRTLRYARDAAGRTLTPSTRAPGDGAR